LYGDKEEIKFVTAIIGEPAIEWLNKDMFKTSKAIEAMSNCDVVVFPESWENYQNCVAECFTALIYGMKVIVVEEADNEDGSVDKIYLSSANIPLSKTLDTLDEPQLIDTSTDESGDVTEIYIDDDLDITDVTFMYNSY
jgi:hypothetical protein